MQQTMLLWTLVKTFLILNALEHAHIAMDATPLVRRHMSTTNGLFSMEMVRLQEVKYCKRTGFGRVKDVCFPTKMSQQ